MIFGLPLTVYTLFRFMISNDMGELDSIFNTLYAFIMIIWSTIFVEKWKNNE